VADVEDGAADRAVGKCEPSRRLLHGILGVLVA
jgi:hypothetical protein